MVLVRIIYSKLNVITHCDCFLFVFQASLSSRSNHITTSWPAMSSHWIGEPPSKTSSRTICASLGSTPFNVVVLLAAGFAFAAAGLCTGELLGPCKVKKNELIKWQYSLFAFLYRLVQALIVQGVHKLHLQFQL